MMRTPHAMIVCGALALIACGSKDDGGKAKSGDEAKAGAVTKKKAPPPKAVAPALKAPASVIAYGGTNGLMETLKKAHTLAGKVAPLPPPDQLGTQATQMVAGDLRLKDGKALDLTKPLRFAILDPKKHRDPLMLVGVKSKDALVASLPDMERKEKDQGNAYSYLKYKGSTRPVFVNFIDGFAVFTRDKGAFSSRHSPRQTCRISGPSMSRSTTCSPSSATSSTRASPRRSRRSRWSGAARRGPTPTR